MDGLGIGVIVAVLAVATAIGLWHRRTDGMIRDEAVEKKRRADILAAAGLEVVELPDRSSRSKSENATNAAKAASTAAAAAAHGTAKPSGRPAEAHPKRGDSTSGPLSTTRIVPRLARTATATPATDADAPTEPAGAAHVAADSPGGTAAAAETPVVVPDAREEPGVVEEAAPDDGAGEERLDRGLLDRLGVGDADVTLLQFSSAFCAPCRAVRRVSGEVAALLPGVQHVEVDAESHLDEVRALRIWRTPTLLIVDAAGTVVKRATGVPTKPQLIAAVAGLLPEA